MINILHTIDTTGPGGAETVFVNLVKGLDKERFRPTVAIPGKGWIYDELVRYGFTPKFLSSKGSFSVRYLLQIMSVIKRNSIDIIQSHLVGSNVYCSLAGLLCRVPVISTIHGFADMDKDDRMSRLRFFLINNGSSHIVFVSNHLRDHFVKNYRINSQKALTIYNGIDLDAYQKSDSAGISRELCIGSKHIIIGSVGNIRKSKGYDTLLKAAAQVTGRYPESRFLIVGEGSGPLYNELLVLRKKLDLDEKVHFLGYREDVPEMMKAFDIFVLPSTSEGFSIVTLEAMACRIPVVVTKSGGPEEIVDEKSGVIVPPSDDKALANGIIKLIEDKFLRTTYVNNAHEIVTSRFSMKAMLNDYSKLYSY